MATASGVVRFGSFIGGSISTAAGFAAGAATAPTLRPILQELENSTWARLPTKPLDVGTVAAIVAEDVEKYQWGQDEAGNTGFGPHRFSAVLGEALNAPDLGTLYNLWRRGYITEADFRHGLRKAKLEGLWDDGLEKLKAARLAGAQIALGIVRTLFDSHGLIVGENDTTGGKIAPTPVSSINPLTEAESWGIDAERLRVMVGEIGLPMALQAAASAVFRGIIDKPDFYLAVAQGDTRPAWADAIFEQARQILSATDWVNAHLRGYRTEKEMRDGAALHGMSQADVDLLYLIHGRPAAPGQMATAAARGIDGPEKRPMDFDQFEQGIKESDIKSKYAKMLWESRFLYPPLFQITRLVQGEVIDADTARDWAIKDRYPPEVTNKLHAYWSKAPSGATDSHVTKAHNSLWTTMVASYTAAESDAAALRPGFDQLDIPAAARTEILATLDVRRDLIRKQLTPAQIKKAWQKAVTNEATGQPWTYDDALAALLSRGWAHADASTFLNT